MSRNNALRTHVVAARLSDNEHAQFEILRGRYGLSQARYVRAMVLAETVPVTIPEVNRTVWRELAPVGANLNQLTRSLNAVRRTLMSASPLSAAAAEQTLDLIKETADLVKIYRMTIIGGGSEG